MTTKAKVCRACLAAIRAETEANRGRDPMDPPICTADVKCPECNPNGNQQ